jgi:fructose-1,6-bisphosphatase I
MVMKLSGQTLDSYFGITPKTPATALQAVLLTIAEACALLADEIEAPRRTGQALDPRTAIYTGGDTPQVLDARAHDLVIDSLSKAPVQSVASEEAAELVILDPAAPYAVATDPLDGSSNIAVNGPIGTIFSVVDGVDMSVSAPLDAFVGNVPAIRAAGMVIFGPRTTLVLSTGDGTDVFQLCRESGDFVLEQSKVVLSHDTSEFAINLSNYFSWDVGTRRYVDDLLAGSLGERGVDFNMRWLAALVGEAYRILVRGGIFLYPTDSREGYAEGRLRLIYEAQPVAFLIEQAGGAATNGDIRVLDIAPSSLHQRTGLTFGSKNEVAAAAGYQNASTAPSVSPLFGERGLFRDAGI